MADERLRSLEREGNSAHATCRAVGHAWEGVEFEGGGAQDPHGYFKLAPFRLNPAKARQTGLDLSASFHLFMVSLQRARQGLDSMEWALLSRQRPRLCTRCNSLEQRWGPWRWGPALGALAPEWRRTALAAQPREAGAP